MIDLKDQGDDYQNPFVLKQIGNLPLKTRNLSKYFRLIF